MISLIVARNKKNVIGNNGKIPWRCSEDMKNFKELTTGNVVLMGRKTFESLNYKPLKNRSNGIITSLTPKQMFEKMFSRELYDNDREAFDKIYKETSLPFVFDSVETALHWYQRSDIFVIGGSEIYKHFMDNDFVDVVYLSEIEDDSDGDIFFDYKFDNNDWDVLEVKVFNEFTLKKLKRNK